MVRPIPLRAGRVAAGRAVTRLIAHSGLSRRDFASEADLTLTRLLQLESGADLPTQEERFNLWAAAEWIMLWRGRHVGGTL